MASSKVRATVSGFGICTDVTMTPPYHHACPPQVRATVGFGICMDINPHEFEAPWSAYEARHGGVTVVCPWCDAREFEAPQRADEAREQSFGSRAEPPTHHP